MFLMKSIFTFQKEIKMSNMNILSFLIVRKIEFSQNLKKSFFSFLKSQKTYFVKVTNFSRILWWFFVISTNSFTANSISCLIGIIKQFANLEGCYLRTPYQKRADIFILAEMNSTSVKLAKNCFYKFSHAHKSANDFHSLKWTHLIITWPSENCLTSFIVWF